MFKYGFILMALLFSFSAVSADKVLVVSEKAVLYKAETGDKVKGWIKKGEKVTLLSKNADRSWVKNYFGAKGWIANHELDLALVQETGDLKVVQSGPKSN